MSLSSESLTYTISKLNNEFAGRISNDPLQYFQDRKIHIHRRNRPYVWDIKMQHKLLDSILQGYYIPPIICSHSITEDRKERLCVMDGGNRITTIRKILNGEIRELTEEERDKIKDTIIYVVSMKNLTVKQEREMFRRLNKSVRVSDGQLYAMSEDDSPLVREAIALLRESEHPLRHLMNEHFPGTISVDDTSGSNIEIAVALVSGALYGVDYITKSYNVQEVKIECQKVIDRAMVAKRLGDVFSIFDLADSVRRSSNKQKKKIQWNVGKLLGTMLYDYHTLAFKDSEFCEEGYNLVRDKWTAYIVKMREFPEVADEVFDISGAQNLKSSKYNKISVKVNIYLNEDRIAPSAEIAEIMKTMQQQQNDMDEEAEAETEL
jgi:hypothetical protein